MKGFSNQWQHLRSELSRQKTSRSPGDGIFSPLFAAPPNADELLDHLHIQGLGWGP